MPPLERLRQLNILVRHHHLRSSHHSVTIPTTRRVYVTFSHLWFDAPGGILTAASQTVLPFYTLKGLEVKKASLTGQGGLLFQDHTDTKDFFLGLSR